MVPKKYPMKKKADPRHKQRIKTVKKLFEQNFRNKIDFDKGSEAEKITASQKKNRCHNQKICTQLAY